jgi:IS30 family transposase
VLARNAAMCDIVASRLALEWSPEQISGWLKDELPHDSSLRVSHETIYRSLFIQALGVLKKELMQHLRSGRRLRRATKTDTLEAVCDSGLYCIPAIHLEKRLDFAHDLRSRRTRQALCRKPGAVPRGAGGAKGPRQRHYGAHASGVAS